MTKSVSQYKNGNSKQSPHKLSNKNLASETFDEQAQFIHTPKNARLTPSEVLRLQRTVGNRAVTHLLQRESIPLKINSHITGLHSHPLHVQRTSKERIDNGNCRITVTGGRAATSWSIAGNSRKPLAIIFGTIPDGEGRRNIEIHVHLNAYNPISTFSGANVRYEGDAAGFAYWDADTVENTGWLKNALRAGIPDWANKNTWIRAIGGKDIQWMNMNVNAGWRFELATRKAARRHNLNYKVSFEISRPNFKKGDTLDSKKDDTTDDLQKLCGQHVIVTFEKGGKSSSKWTMNLIYANEQYANDQLASDMYEIRTRKESADKFQHTPSNQWD